jgi:hypothetical protein
MSARMTKPFGDGNRWIGVSAPGGATSIQRFPSPGGVHRSVPWDWCD